MWLRKVPSTKNFLIPRTLTQNTTSEPNIFCCRRQCDFADHKGNFDRRGDSICFCFTFFLRGSFLNLSRTIILINNLLYASSARLISLQVNHVVGGLSKNWM